MWTRKKEKRIEMRWRELLGKKNKGKDTKMRHNNERKQFYLKAFFIMVLYLFCKKMEIYIGVGLYRF